MHSCSEGELHFSPGFNKKWSLKLLASMTPICFKGIVHFEINVWYVSAYLKGIQDVGVFVSTVFSILIF